MTRRTVVLGFAACLATCSSLFLLPYSSNAQLARRETTLQPPIAQVVPFALEKHGDVRIDNYYWLRERENPDVIAYLKAENSYTQSVMAHTEVMQESLYQEIVARIKEDDDTVPYKKGNFWYYERYVEGGEYPIYCRRNGSTNAAENVMLDVNALAAGHEFFSSRGLRVSADETLLAYSTDTVGRRFYTLRVRNFDTGADLDDTIPDITANCVWANDNRTLFYTKQHPETLRWYRIYKHVLGTNHNQDELVYEEQDEEFECWVFKTKSQRFIILASEQSLSSEYRFLEADDPDGTFRVINPREPNHEYSVEHYGDRFLIRTNHEAKNFRLMETPITATSRANWTKVIAHRDDVFLEEFEIFRDHLVVEERKGGLLQLHVVPWDGSEDYYVDFGEPAYQAYVDDNYEFDTNTLRYVYSSLTTPKSVFDYDMIARQKTLLKEEEIVGDFDKRNYLTERLHATAGDGALVPISIVYHKDLKKDGANPLLLYGYGSYGSSLDASFRAYRLSLLDRGFVFAIAHVRGGQELGRDWYENGKLMHKKNTFTDFIDCAKHLINEAYTRENRLFAEGGSAGGLLMGAITNMAPEMFRGVVNHVPFVDVITTMLDTNIPLTTSEYDEWGDPSEKDAYEYILSYSPYDNIEAKAYPNILVTTGLHDSQVQYWEPAKYVAKLRAFKTDANRLLLKTNMEAGHGGASGRFKRHRETAFAYAFILDLLEGADYSAR